MLPGPKHRGYALRFDSHPFGGRVSQGGNGLNFDTNVWVEIVEPPEGTIDRCSDQGEFARSRPGIDPYDAQHEGDHCNFELFQACAEGQEGSSGPRQCD